MNERHDFYKYFLYSDLKKCEYLENFKNLYKIDRFLKDEDLKTFMKSVQFVFEILLSNDNVPKYDGWETALEIIYYVKNNNKSVNCLSHAIVLRDTLTSLGFYTRVVECLPENSLGYAHAVIEVFSKTYNKWIMLDPAFGILLTGAAVYGNSTPISVIKLKEAILNNDEINIISCGRIVRFRDADSEPVDIKDKYIDFMKTALYSLNYKYYIFDEDSIFNVQQCTLVPAEYTMEGKANCTNNSAIIYQSPYDWAAK